MKILRETKIKILSSIAIFFALSFVFKPALAQTADQKKAILQSRLNQLEGQIKTLQNSLSSNRQQQASLNNEIKLYDGQIQTMELQIQAKETQIEGTNLQISELEAQIARRTAEMEENKVLLGSLIAELYRQDANSLLHIGLGNGNFSEFLDQLQYTESVQGKVYQIVQNIKAVKQKLEEQKTDLEAQLVQLKQLREQLDQTQSSLQVQRKGKEALLSQTRNSEKKYQQVLSASNKEASDLQKEISGLDDAVRAKLGKRTIVPGNGVLSKPVDGVLTQRYGNTGFTALGYNFHNGVDIAGPCGVPVYAAAAGAVNYTGTGQGAYGNWITIKHTIATKSGTRDIVTLYGHLRTIKVAKGQKVNRGDLIGYEGNTGNTTRLLYGPERGCHVHFTVFDAEGFNIAPGANVKAYGPYQVPNGYTYDPFSFF